MALPDSIYVRIREALEQHREELEAGTITMEEIATAHGLKPHISTMYVEKRTMGIEQRAGRPVEIDHAKVIRLYEQGMKVAQIQREIGHPNRQAIDKIVKRYLVEKQNK